MSTNQNNTTPRGNEKDEMMIEQSDGYYFLVGDSGILFLSNSCIHSFMAAVTSAYILYIATGLIKMVLNNPHTDEH